MMALWAIVSDDGRVGPDDGFVGQILRLVVVCCCESKRKEEVTKC